MKKNNHPGLNETKQFSIKVSSEVNEGKGMKGTRHNEGVKTLLTLAFVWFALLTMPGALAQGAPAGGGATTQGAAGGDQPDGANPGPGSAWTSRQNYFLRFPVAKEAYDFDDVDDQGKSATDGQVQHTANGDMVYQWPSIIPTATSKTPTKRDQVVGKDLFKTFGYPVSDSQFQVIERYNHNRLLEQAFDPERAMWTTQTAAGMGANNAANSIGSSGVNQVCQAIDYCSMYLNNFTAEPGNVWQRIRDQLFIPMAVLLLLPGAVLAQVRAIVAQGSPVLIGQEVHPLEGILRSIVAIFLIPGSFLVINYGIDVANSMTFTIASEYTRLFGSNMYDDAKCAILRAVPVEQAKNRRNAIREEEKVSHKGSTVWAIFEGSTLVTELRDPCAGIDEVRTKDEDVTYTKSLTRIFFNSIVNAQGLTWDLACTFQCVYLYYLWCMGPIAAALWVWPVASLRAALGSWCEGVITVCFWSLFWNTVILLMACFRGVGDSGTIVQSALLMLAIASVQSAFDFAGLASTLVSSAMQFAASAAGQMNGGAGGGGAGKANSAGGHGGGAQHQGGAGAGAGAGTAQHPGQHSGNGAQTADTSGGANNATGASASTTAGGADAAKGVEASAASNASASGLSLNTSGAAGSGSGAGGTGAGGPGTGEGGKGSGSADAATGTQASTSAGGVEHPLPPASEGGKGAKRGLGGGGEGGGEGSGSGGEGHGGAGSPVSASVGLSLTGGSSVSNVSSNNHLPPGIGGDINSHAGVGANGAIDANGGKGVDLAGTGAGATGATGGTGSLDPSGKPIGGPLDLGGADGTGTTAGTSSTGGLQSGNAADPGIAGANGTGSALPPSSGLSNNLANPGGDGVTHGLHSAVDNSNAQSFTTTDANGNTTLDTGKVGNLPPIAAGNLGDSNAGLAQQTTRDIMAMGGVTTGQLDQALSSPGSAAYGDIKAATGVAPELLRAGLDGNSAAATVAAAGFGETPLAQSFSGSNSTAALSTAMAQSLDPGVASSAAYNMDTGAARQMLSSSNGAVDSFQQAVSSYGGGASASYNDGGLQLGTPSGAPSSFTADAGSSYTYGTGTGIGTGSTVSSDGGYATGSSVGMTTPTSGGDGTLSRSIGDVGGGVAGVSPGGTTYGAGDTSITSSSTSYGAPVDNSTTASTSYTASGNSSTTNIDGGVYTGSGGAPAQHISSSGGDMNLSTTTGGSSTSYAIDGSSSSVNTGPAPNGVGGGGDLSRVVDGGSYNASSSYTAPSTSIDAGVSNNVTTSGGSYTAGDNNVTSMHNGGGSSTTVAQGDINLGAPSSNVSGASYSQDTTINTGGGGAVQTSGNTFNDGGTTYGASSAGVSSGGDNFYQAGTGGAPAYTSGGNVVDNGSSSVVNNGPSVSSTNIGGDYVQTSSSGSSGSVVSSSDGGGGYTGSQTQSVASGGTSSDPGVVTNYGSGAPTSGPSIDNSTVYSSGGQTLAASGSAGIPDGNVGSYPTAAGGWVGSAPGDGGSGGIIASSGGQTYVDNSSSAAPSYATPSGSSYVDNSSSAAPSYTTPSSSSYVDSSSSSVSSHPTPGGGTYVDNSSTSAPTYSAQGGGTYVDNSSSSAPTFTASSGSSYVDNSSSSAPTSAVSSGGTYVDNSSAGQTIASSGSPAPYTDGGTVQSQNYGSSSPAPYSGDVTPVYPSQSGGGQVFVANNDTQSGSSGGATYTPAAIDPPSGGNVYRDAAPSYDSSSTPVYQDNSGGYQQTADNSGYTAPVYQADTSAPAPTYQASADQGSGQQWVDQGSPGPFVENTAPREASSGEGGYTPHHGGGQHHAPSAGDYYVASNDSGGAAPYVPAPRNEYSSGSSGPAHVSGAAKSFKDVLGAGGAGAAFAFGNKQAPLAKPASPEAKGAEPKTPPPTEVASAAPPKRAAFGPAANANRQSGKSQKEIDEENRRLMAQMGEIPKTNEDPHNA